ncbi:MAG: hypothetical protein ACOX3W_04805 [Christensenellaceae bacterium]
MELKLIDMNAKFAEDYMKWAVEHPEEVEQAERLDDLYYEMYAAWLSTPKEWLEGQSPQAYFETIDDPQMYVSAFIAYILEEIDLPDALVACMLEQQEGVYPILRGILLEENVEEMAVTLEGLQMIQAESIKLIEEMGKEHPYERYIIFLEREEEDTLLAETAAEALLAATEDLMEPLLYAYARAEGYGRSALLDLLSYYVGDERVLRILQSELAEEALPLPFLAICAGRFGDEALLPMLKEMVTRPEIDYETFMALSGAIEAISGEEIEMRDFSGDMIYDYLESQYEDDDDDEE